MSDCSVSVAIRPRLVSGGLSPLCIDRRCKSSKRIHEVLLLMQKTARYVTVPEAPQLTVIEFFASN